MNNKLRQRMETLKTDTRDWLKNWAENGLPEHNDWAFNLVGPCPNGCPTDQQKEQFGITEGCQIVSVVFNYTPGEIEEKWQIYCALCGYEGPKAPTKQLAVVEYLVQQNKRLRAIIEELPDEAEERPTLDELKESGEWFLIRPVDDSEDIGPPIAVQGTDDDEYPYWDFSRSKFHPLLPGELFKRICDRDWVEVGDE